MLSLKLEKDKNGVWPDCRGSDGDGDPVKEETGRSEEGVRKE
ncbi:MAG: hypothetical protein RBU30_09590 [Polyangia bacterium]|jgi:hypothetical protein|nr:hypothetical protein [Polyangia bacterium]